MARRPSPSEVIPILMVVLQDRSLSAEEILLELEEVGTFLSEAQLTHVLSSYVWFFRRDSRESWSLVASRNAVKAAGVKSPPSESQSGRAYVVRRVGANEKCRCQDFRAPRCANCPPMGDWR